MRYRLRLTSTVRTILAGAAFVVSVTLLMLWLAGKFSAKIPVDAAGGRASPFQPVGVTLVEARTVLVPVMESAVGTVQAQHETTIGSQILARVVDIQLRAGQPVRQGDLLVRLDATDLQAHLEQAESAAAAAMAEYDQRVTDEGRLGPLVKTNAVSKSDYDRAVTALKSAQANLTRANHAISEARAVLSYATIRAPIDGIVVDKKVDIGDTVSPGQALLSLYDPTRLQLVANVRDSLARRLTLGQPISIHLDAVEKTYVGKVSEIVPDSQSASRTFQVKVTGSFPPTLYTGMFGRIFIPLDDQALLLIPRSAISPVGQLELVNVLDGGVERRRAVRTGQSVGTDCEVLSGLRAGEKVIVPAAGTRPLTTEPAREVSL